MKEFKGTKGEWGSDMTYAFSNKCIIKNYEGRIIASVYDENGSKLRTENQKANTQLIAAAPDLLEALMQCKRVLDIAPIIGKEKLLDSVNNAINKALGE